MICRVNADLRDLAAREDKAEVRQQIVDKRIDELIDEFESVSGDWMAECWPSNYVNAIARMGEFIVEIEHLVFKGDRDTALIDIKAMFEKKHRQAAEQMAQREVE